MNNELSIDHLTTYFETHLKRTLTIKERSVIMWMVDENECSKQNKEEFGKLVLYNNS